MSRSAQGLFFGPNPSTNPVSVMKKEQFLFRFLITGACTVVLTGRVSPLAEPPRTALPPAVTVATAAAEAAPATQAQAVRAAAIEAAAPTGRRRSRDVGRRRLTAQDAATPAETRLTRFASRPPLRRRHRPPQRGSSRSTLTRNAMRFLGVPYVFGGTSSSGFDCSGYVQHVFAMLGHHIPRTADAQYDAGKRVAGASMVAGDLVFFQTYADGAVARRDLSRQRPLRPRLVEPRRHRLEPARAATGRRAISEQNGSSVIEEQQDYQRAASAYLVWPLALAALVREAPDASRWTRIHTRQALTFGLVASIGFVVVMALPLLTVIVATPASRPARRSPSTRPDCSSTRSCSSSLTVLAFSYSARAGRGELFTIPLVSALADRVFRDSLSAKGSEAVSSN